MRRLLPALILIAVSTVLGVGAVGPLGIASPSYAASAKGCSEFSGQHLSRPVRDQLLHATQHVDAVFEGSVHLPRHAATNGALKVRVHVLAAWKGDARAGTTVTVLLQPGQCRTWTLAHRSPEDYLFLVSAGHTNGRFTASGTAPRVLAHTPAIEKVLGTPTLSRGEGGSEKVVFDRVGSTRPRSFARLAAPGAALALIAVLGLLVVGRLARRA